MELKIFEGLVGYLDLELVTMYSAMQLRTCGYSDPRDDGSHSKALCRHQILPFTYVGALAKDKLVRVHRDGTKFLPTYHTPHTETQHLQVRTCRR